jgi:hypothetical protein
VPQVTSGELHRVQLPRDTPRGGLLTQASMLTMNSDGIDAHPIRRGVWLLDRLLNDPPPPPPPNVPQIDQEDADFRGLSLKQRIQRHREPGSCRNCHQGIDPWGLPFESFDATGHWRITARDDQKGPESASRDPIDSAATLPDGTVIDGIRDLKIYLIEHRVEQFIRSLVHHMVTYAIGRKPDFADRRELEAIHRRFADSGYRLKELVLAVFESPVFQE